MALTNKDKSILIQKIFSKKDTTYLTHNYHPYAAKFIPQIPRFFIKRFTKEDEIVMDPFCGSGTALVEALLLKRNAVGVDAHPIATLVSKVKTTPLDNERLNFILQWIRELPKNYKFTTNTIANYLYKQEQKQKDYNNSSSIYPYADLIDFPNKYHWFKRDVLNAVVYIKLKIEEIDDKDIRDFLLVALSSIIVKVSNQESETRYVAIKKNVTEKDVFKLFTQKVVDMVNRMKEFSLKVSNNNWVKIFTADSRYLDFIEDDSVDLIITSPPYPNTYDYYLYHKLRMYILGYDVKSVREKEIGSRHKHSSKGEGIQQYVKDMVLCFEHFRRILKPKKYFIIVVGDSIIRGKKYDAYEIISEIAEKTSFTIEDHISYSLDVISKMFNRAFRSKGKNEHVIILKNNKK